MAGHGPIPTYIPSINIEPINGNYIQTLCYLGNKFTPTNGSWMQTFASEFVGEFNTGSHLLDMAYGIWQDTIGVGEFELVNGNCWESLFVWTGFKDMADALALTYPEFATYPYNGSWENTIMQLLIVQNSGVIPMPPVPGPVQKIDIFGPQNNTMSESIFVDMTPYYVPAYSTGGTGLVLEFSPVNEYLFDVIINVNGDGYFVNDYFYIPGGSIPEIPNDLYITVVIVGDPLGIVSEISYDANQTNAMGTNTYDITLDGDTNGVGAIFNFKAASSSIIKVSVVDGGLGYTAGQVLFVPGDTVPDLSNDLYITITSVL